MRWGCPPLHPLAACPAAHLHARRGVEMGWERGTPEWQQTAQTHSLTPPLATGLDCAGCACRVHTSSRIPHPRGATSYREAGSTPLTYLSGFMWAQMIHDGINRWLSVRMEAIGTLIIFATACLCVLAPPTVSGVGFLGIVLAYAANVTPLLNFGVRQVTETEAKMTSFERIQEYASVRAEAARHTAEDAQLPKGWPASGAVEFDGCSLRYRHDLDLVLNAVSFKVQAGSSLGICGRTGAGKSSIMVRYGTLVLRLRERALKSDDRSAKGRVNPITGSVGTLSHSALPRALSLTHHYATTDAKHQCICCNLAPLSQVAMFRLAELAAGRILIDGVDIATLGLRKLRSNVVIMPQDAFLFAATVRANLDPTGLALSDAPLWDVLEAVRMEAFVRGLGGLDALLTEAGDNLSAGQVCRAPYKSELNSCIMYPRSLPA
jgi:ABC-type iron transport system FetAB ATPase subunit